MVFSAARSARLTKSPAPFIETCRFSTSPKSLISPRPALRAALSMTLRLALPCMIGLLRDQAGAIRRVAGAGKGPLPSHLSATKGRIGPGPLIVHGCSEWTSPAHPLRLGLWRLRACLASMQNAYYRSDDRRERFVSLRQISTSRG